MLQKVIKDSFRQYLLHPVYQNFWIVAVTVFLVFAFDVFVVAVFSSSGDNVMWAILDGAVVIFAFALLWSLVEGLLYFLATALDAWGLFLSRAMPYIMPLGVLYLLLIGPQLDFVNRFIGKDQYVYIWVAVTMFIAVITGLLALLLLMRLSKASQALHLAVTLALAYLFHTITSAGILDAIEGDDFFSPRAMKYMAFWAWLIVASVISLYSFVLRVRLFRMQYEPMQKPHRLMAVLFFSIGILITVVDFQTGRSLFVREAYTMEHYCLQILAFLCFEIGVTIVTMHAFAPAKNEIAAKFRRFQERAAIGIIVVLIVFTWLAFTFSPLNRTSLQVLDRKANFTLLSSSLFQGATDFDGDSFSRGFLHGDCDDSDPEINPNSLDIPDNGLDEDCSGADDSLSDIPDYATVQKMIAELKAPKKKLKKRPNVVLVTIDTLRADRMSVNGYHRNTTPNIIKFAEKATNFTNAYASGTRTAMSMASILKGKYALNIQWKKAIWQHGLIIDPEKISKQKLTELRKEGIFYTSVPTNDESPDIAQLFNAEGYETIFVGTDGYSLFFSPEFGYTKNFNSRFNPNLGTNKIHNAEELTESFWEFFEKRNKKRPFLFWFHFEDPHSPYTNYPEYQVWGKSSSDRYDSNIRYWDENFGKWWRQFKKLPAAKNTIIAITSDHGEAFGEHESSYHGTTVYNEQTNVPLIIRLPGIKTPKVIEENVSITDVTPTLLDIAKGGISAKRKLQFDGVSLWPLMDGRPQLYRDRPVFTEIFRMISKYGYITTNRKAVYLRNWKLTHNLKNGSYELFDLLEDPAELNNQMEKKLREFQLLKNSLKGWQAGKDFLF